MEVPVEICDLAALCDSEHSRYALGAVMIRRVEGERRIDAAATDGRVIGVLSWVGESVHEGPEQQILVPQEVFGSLRQFLEAVPKHVFHPALQLSGDDCRSTFTIHGTAKLDCINVVGRFPKIDSVFTGQKLKGAATRFLPPKQARHLFHLATVVANHDEGQVNIDLQGENYVEVRSNNDKVTFRGLICGVDGLPDEPPPGRSALSGDHWKMRAKQLETELDEAKSKLVLARKRLKDTLDEVLWE